MKKEHSSHTRHQALTGTGAGVVVAALAAIASVGCMDGTQGGSDVAGPTENVAQVGQAMNVYGKWLRPKNGGKCMDDPGGSTADAIQYGTYTCGSSNNLKFDITDPGANGKHLIRNLTSNKCLWVTDSQNSRWVEQRACNSGDSKQLWYLNSKGNKEWELKNVSTGTCMDLKGGGMTNGTKIQAYACNNGWNQRFHIQTPATQDFRDDFNDQSPNTAPNINWSNWSDQLIWVNNEIQCYEANNNYRYVAPGSGRLTIKLKNVGTNYACANKSKTGQSHPSTKYFAGRVVTKNKREYTRGKWTARIRMWAYNGGYQAASGQAGMFPAFWLLEGRNNEWQAPGPNPDENVCWPKPGSGEIDIMEHYGSSGPNKYTGRQITQVSPFGCDNGEWSSTEVHGYTQLNDNTGDGIGEWHEYASEIVKNDLYITLDNVVIASQQIDGRFAEPMFAILNYAKITSDAMNGEWGMDVDWIKHETGTDGSLQ